MPRPFSNPSRTKAGIFSNSCYFRNLICDSFGLRLSTDVDELAFAEAPKPRALPLRESPRVVDDASNHLIAIVFAVQIRNRFTIANCLSAPSG